MTKKKTGPKDKPFTEQADGSVGIGVGIGIGVDRASGTADADRVLTSAPRTPASSARKKLLKAIAGEATAISKAKRRGRSCKALKDLARAYALVAAEETRSGLTAPARTGNGGARTKSGGRGILPSMRTVFLAKGASGRKSKGDGG
ncbi:hypothetical protein [Streptomyces paromomycinus]|uniref:Uncharacterized protein n=1 Tax=Streptomyces paromomycinus TaxID=92743 RepID=A0A401VTU7_STREY|nr:hypothetical protein [Streptomyces paromomycinus]GCD40505.1 hypothetical protein GKJPGBOP_00154 [Streptomyces paromomycinus]